MNLGKEVVCSIPLQGGKVYDITRDQADELQAKYPGIRVMMVLPKIVAWNERHASGRKTARGIKKHVEHWLGNAEHDALWRRENDEREKPRESRFR